MKDRGEASSALPPGLGGGCFLTVRPLKHQRLNFDTVAGVWPRTAQELVYISNRPDTHLGKTSMVTRRIVQVGRGISLCLPGSRAEAPFFCF